MTVGRMVAVACVLVPLMGTPVAHAETAPSAATAAQTAAQTPDAQQRGEAGDEPPWGLLGLTGLLGLVGLARRRRRPVVADPLSPYPVMRATDAARRRDPHASAPGMPAVGGPQPPQPPQPPSLSQASQQPGGAFGNAGVPRALTAHTPPAIPAQNPGVHERLPTTSRPVPAPRSAAAPSDSSPTSVTSDGNIRLAPAPPLHANRLSPPNLDISGIPGMADAPPAKPRWPQREYD
ncbi:WGxxGxxG family protein [Saccharomonospora cyanea]|uniref:WGxxGxxG family protein n=1 Tax=Saccharomonospora cyanea TaxID=40989 RepID=UPI0012F72CF2|nr:WGxxGxxG family protein [Saccharomonospora cyanea]